MMIRKVNNNCGIRCMFFGYTDRLGIVTTLMSIVILFFTITSSAIAVDYYADANAESDSGTGLSPESPLKTLGDASAIELGPGDTLYLKRGSVWSEGMNINRSGLPQNELHITAYGQGDEPVLRYIRLDGNDVTISDIVVDRNKEAADAIQLSGDNCTLDNMTVQNGTNDGIDIHNANNILIQNCVIRFFLNGSFSNQADAHGIVATATQGITIRNTEVHHVSGDSFQADPNRDPGDLTTDILIEQCYFWTAPLEEDFNSGWVKTSHLTDAEKQYPGENAIDTKVVKQDWEGVPRTQIRIVDTTAHGWKNDGFITNKAAFNIKEKVEAVLDGITVYDCEIAFRLRGTRGNANTTIMNAVAYNCDVAVRTEDDLASFKLLNSTFGENIGTMLTAVSSSSGFDTWDIQNNAFINTKPIYAAHPSNVVVSAGDADSYFENISSGNYRLKLSAVDLIDNGAFLASVGYDRDRQVRTAPYDIGAYQYTESGPVDVPSRVTNLRIVDNLQP